MKRRAFTLTFLALACFALCPNTSYSLTFEERIEAQRAIERVYYEERAAYTRETSPQTVIKPFEETVSDSVIRGKVEKTLLQSAIVGDWASRGQGYALDEERLQLELERICRSSKAPETLKRLFATLDNNAYLVKEIMVRPVLAEKMTRTLYQKDAEFHREANEKAQVILAEILALEGKHMEQTAQAWGAEYGKAQFRNKESDNSFESTDHVIELEIDELTRSYTELLGTQNVPKMRETDEGFVIEKLVGDMSNNSFKTESILIKKRPYEEWLSKQTRAFEDVEFQKLNYSDSDGSAPNAIGIPIKPLPPILSPLACVPDSWVEQLGPPEARHVHTAIWTGTEMIVWGGLTMSVRMNSGSRYNPTTDTWLPTTTLNAPKGRFDHVAVWTGAKMIVWGGSGPLWLVNSGGQYDPVSDSWSPTSQVDAPAERQRIDAVWTGTELIVWGGWDGSPLKSGGRYNPSSDTWTPTTQSGCPSNRMEHTCVWSGTEMIVWGGWDGFSIDYDTGGRYNPLTDTWTSTSTINAPTPRKEHTSVWTGDEMIIWGGHSGLDTGGRYDPLTDSWITTTTVNVPSRSYDHSAIWTGSEMIVWGGSGSPAYQNTGGRYNPITDSWIATSLIDVPQGRVRHTGVWTGTEMIIWGGYGQSPEYKNSGARYDPVSDTWLPTSMRGALGYLTRSSAVWTGTEMIVWGGKRSTSFYNNGYRYNLALDTWSEISAIDAPSARTKQSAVWTGLEMIIWGGEEGCCTPVNDGSKYDPVSDNWTLMTPSDAPPPRSNHSTVWSGTELIVWGGWDGTELQTGGVYDPNVDVWIPTSIVNAPVPRFDHSAVWSEYGMIVWGGREVSSPGYDSGSLFSLSTDTWTDITTTGAPVARATHSAEWSGTEMVIWGGSRFAGVLNSGGKYDPVSDTWAPTSLTNVPSARNRHTSIWTGNEMIVWGGNDQGDMADSGGHYDPVSDTWYPTSPINPPKARFDHVAVWTGNEMIVWGGESNMELNTGGIYRYGLPAFPLKLSPIDEFHLPSGSASAQVTWDSVSGAVSYDYEISDASCGGSVFTSGNITGTTQLVLGLIDGTTYYWRIRSVDSCGVSSWSGCWSFTVNSDVVGLVPDGGVVAGAQMIVSSQNSGTELQLDWDASACPSGDYFLAYGSMATMSSYSYSGTSCGLGVTGSATVPMLSGSVFFYVVGTDGLGTDGPHGWDSNGIVIPASGIGTCGITVQDTSPVCP